MSPMRARTGLNPFLEAKASQMLDGPIAVLGTHFNHPTAGRILRHGDAWRFVAPA